MTFRTMVNRVMDDADVTLNASKAPGPTEARKTGVGGRVGPWGKEAGGRGWGWWAAEVAVGARSRGGRTTRGVGMRQVPGGVLRAAAPKHGPWPRKAR